MEKLMNICMTLVQHPAAAHKQMMLAVDAVKVRKEYGLDLSNPNNLCVNGKNPLFEACRSGNIPLVKLFLSSGAELNVIDSEGITPLYYSMTSHNGSHKMVDFLLSAGSNSNLYSMGKCPLLASFYRMKIDTSVLLMKNGADVNNVILPSFCFVESVFALNSNLVMIASGVRFNLEDFNQLILLASDIVYAGLHPRTFYLYGRRFLREGFTPNEMASLWSFQCLCMAAGFRVDLRSLLDTIADLHQAIPSIADSAHQRCLQQHLKNMLIMKSVMVNPLSLMRHCRISIRSRIAGTVSASAVTKHLNYKIASLPLPDMCKNFLCLKVL